MRTKSRVRRETTNVDRSKHQGDRSGELFDGHVRMVMHGSAAASLKISSMET